MSTLTVGNQAPAFSLPDLDGRPVRLADFRGRKVLLVFFRYATCPFFARIDRFAAGTHAEDMRHV